MNLYVCVNKHREFLALFELIHACLKNSFTSGKIKEIRPECFGDFLCQLKKEKQYEACPEPMIFFLDAELKDSQSGMVLAEEINLLFPEAKLFLCSSRYEYGALLYRLKNTVFLLKNQVPNLLPNLLDQCLKEWKNKEPPVIARRYNKKYLIEPDSILYLTSYGRNTRLVMDCQTSTKELIVSGPLGQFASIQLSHPEFIFCHQSFLVNTAHARFVKGDELLLDNGDWIPVSRRQKNSLFKTMHRTDDSSVC